MTYVDRMDVETTPGDVFMDLSQPRFSCHIQFMPVTSVGSIVTPLVGRWALTGQSQ